MIGRVYEPKVYEDKYLKNKSGIYQIRNLVNNKIYVGSSNNLYRRKTYEHFRELRLNKHHNKYLQNSYNCHGEENFVFEVIEFCIEKERYIIEQYWLDKFYGKDFCYNENPKAGETPHKNRAVICLEDNILFPSVKDASIYYSVSTSGIIRSCTLEILETKNKHFMYYDEYIDSTKDDIKKRMLKRNNIKSIICLNDNNIFNSIAEASRHYECSGAEIRNSCINEGYYSIYGNRFLYYETYLTKTEYEIKNILNTKPKKQKVKCLNNNKIYPSILEASKDLKISRQNISNCIKGKIKNHKGMLFIPL